MIISLPTTVNVNFRCLPFETALKLPIFVGYRIRIGKLIKTLNLDVNPQLYPQLLCSEADGGTEERKPGKKNYRQLNDNDSIQFNGRRTILSGISLTLFLGSLQTGDDFFCNKNCTISCYDKITIGDHELIGWNVKMVDSDNHKLMHKNEEKSCDYGSVEIGENVWIVAFSHILKNSVIPNGSVIANHSLVTKPFGGERLLMGGCQVKVLDEGIKWKR